MRELEKLEQELERRGETGALQKLLQSQAGQRLAESLDAQAVERAARSGDSQALASLLRGVLATEEGRRLAQSVGELLGRGGGHG